MSSPNAQIIRLGGEEEEEGRKQEEGVLVSVCCVCLHACVYVRACWSEEINISATWPLKPLPMTANIMKRYGRQGREWGGGMRKRGEVGEK